MSPRADRAFRPNVLLISLDTLRADVAFSGRFPTFERLRHEGSCFRRVVSSAPLTPVSHASILTGLHPPGHGLRHLLREQLDREVPTLPELLRGAGYNTGAVVSCPGLHRWYGMSRGFEAYDDEIPRLPDGRDPLQVVDVKIRGTALKRAPLVVERALRWLDRGPSQPFFLFVHFFDSHWPYEPPESFGIPLANPYEGEVAYMDHYLGRLLDGLEERGHRLDDLLLLCLSDHGEDLAGWYPNDHGGALGHPEEEGHGCLLFDATQLVPVWLRAPDRVPAGLEVTWQVRLVDIVPTLLDLLGLPEIRCDGRSLLPCLLGREGEHRPAYSETFFPEERARNEPGFRHLRPLKALRTADRFKTIWRIGGDRVELYDLEQDPLEKNPAVLADGPAQSL